MKIRPLHDRILVQPILEKEVRKGGIIIPDSAKETINTQHKLESQYKVEFSWIGKQQDHLGY